MSVVYRSVGSPRSRSRAPRCLSSRTLKAPMSFPWLGITCGACELLLLVPCSMFATIPCPPQVVFALLGPPSLEPVFALQQLIQRVHCAPALRRDLASRLAAAGRASLPDGPLARAQQLMYHPVFQASFQAFLRGSCRPVPTSVNFVRCIGARSGRRLPVSVRSTFRGPVKA